MSKKIKVMILGAGIFQLSAIKKAREYGLHVITLDNIPSNIGHKYSNEQVDCSTADCDRVYDAAKRLKIDGICTFGSDVALPSVACVSEKLGLLGPDLEVVETLIYKHRFREYLRKIGLQCPRFAYGKCSEDVASQVGDFVCPVFVKPTDASGSRGVVRLESYNPKELVVVLNSALVYSKNGIVIVEEYIDGIEVGGDCFLRDGKVAFVAVTNKSKNGFIVTGHSLPSTLSRRQLISIEDVIGCCCKKLNYRNGPMNFDMIVNGDNVWVLELSPRNGGNGIANVIKRAFGVDVEMATIMACLGLEYTLVGFQGRGSGSFIFGSEASGVLKKINGKDDVLDRVPEVYDIMINVKAGDRVRQFQHGGDALGCALFDCADLIKYKKICAKIKSTLSIEVE